MSAKLGEDPQHLHHHEAGGGGGIERDIQHKRQPEQRFENHLMGLVLGLANQSLQCWYQRRSRAARKSWKARAGIMPVWSPSHTRAAGTK